MLHTLGTTKGQEGRKQVLHIGVHFEGTNMIANGFKTTRKPSKTVAVKGCLFLSSRVPDGNGVIDYQPRSPPLADR